MMTIDFIAFNNKPALLLNDPSFIYRCQNIAQGLKEQDQTTQLLHINNYRLHNYNMAQVVVLHRPLYSLRLHTWIKLLKRKGVTIVADIDDLIFHTDFIEHSPALKHKILTHKKVASRYLRHYKALKLCDHITASTAPLYKQLKHYFPDKKISLIHNAIHYSWYQLATELASREQTNQKKVITYFSGTKSHDKDFALIKEPLEAFINENPDISLSITGSLDFDLDIPSTQIQYTPRLKFADDVTQVKKSWLNLCPLEQTPFNECKSALKVIETGFWGVPTIASPNPDISRFISSELAYVADSNNAWYKQLNTLKAQNLTSEFRKSLQTQAIKLADYKKQADIFLSKVIKSE